MNREFKVVLTEIDNIYPYDYSPMDLAGVQKVIISEINIQDAIVTMHILDANSPGLMRHLDGSDSEIILHRGGNINWRGLTFRLDGNGEASFMVETIQQ